MSTESDMRERHERVLAEMAEAGMVMVRGLSAAMEAAADPSAQVQVGLAYYRVSRAVRLTIALEFRLAQAADRAAREPAAPRPAVAPAPAPAPRPSPERGDWYEYERAEADEALEDLDVLLEADDADPEAVHAAVESCIVRIRHDLDLARPTLRRSVSSSVGGGGSREAGWRGKRSSSAFPACPLHHLAGGPLLPEGEETWSRGVQPRSRSALLSAAAALPRPPDPRRSSA